MSDMTRAEEEAADDAMLESQIAEHLAKAELPGDPWQWTGQPAEQGREHEAVIPDDTEPDREPPEEFYALV